MKLATIAALALATGLAAPPARAAGPLVLRAEDVDRRGLFPNFQTWRAKAGDDPSWAAPDLDDSGWEELTVPGVPAEVPGGIVWHRVAIDVDPSLVGATLELAYAHVGAVEAYFDGVLVSRSGDVAAAAAGGPLIARGSPDHLTPIRITRAGRHVFAFRTGNARVERFARLGWPMAAVYPFLAAEGAPAGGLTQLATRAAELRGFFCGASLVLALLHLLLYSFRRERRANLHFAIGAAALATVAMGELRGMQSDTADELIASIVLFRVSVVTASAFLLRFYYEVFSPRPPRRFWLYAATGAAIALASAYIHVAFIFAFSVVTLLDAFVVLLRAVLRRVDGAWIVAIGGTISILAGTVQMAPAFFGAVPPIETAYVYGFLALLVSISVYLARSFTRNERELAARGVALEEAEKRERVLTELEQAHDSLKRTQAQLVQSEKMAALGQLVAGVAHEINTPIGAIHSTNDVLKRATRKLEEALGERTNDAALARPLAAIADALKVIDSGSGRVAEIVRRLRSFARLDEAEKQKADLHVCLEDTFSLVKHQLGSRVRLERRFGELPEVSCYPAQLNQVFLNLLMNATQAIEGEGSITVSTETDGEWARVAFRDTGSGIAPDVLPRIFDPGFTTKGVKVGTGLGLSISYQIMEAHQGRITVESELGKGSTFTVHIPLARG